MYVHIVYRRLGVSPRGIAHCQTPHATHTHTYAHRRVDVAHGSRPRGTDRRLNSENAWSRKIYTRDTATAALTDSRQGHLIRRCVMQIAVMKEDESRRGTLSVTLIHFVAEIMFHELCP